MDFENVKAQMRKGVLEFCILSIVSKNDAYATDILNKLKESELIVVEGTLYPGSAPKILHHYRKRKGSPQGVGNKLERFDPCR
jgi:UDP-N-acetyl-D-mannosaminuronate dehydrogenase